MELKEAKERDASTALSLLWTAMMSLFYHVFVSWQIRLQSKWKPASWVDFAKYHHSEQVEWILHDGLDKSDAMDAVWQAAERLVGYHPESSLVMVHNKEKEPTTRVVIYVLTKRLYWMDQITIDFVNHFAHITAESTGLLPLVVPFACIWNLALFWVPFQDVAGACGKHMNKLRRQSEVLLRENNASQSKAWIQSRTIRYSYSNPKKKKSSQHNDDKTH